MKYYQKLTIFCLQIIFCNTIFGQNFYISNKNENIEIKISGDSLEVAIENKTKKMIYLPLVNEITQNCSDKSKLLAIDFGMDLQTFNERGKFELTRIEPNEKKCYKVKLIECSENKKIQFTFQFYLRKDKKMTNSKILYNTDFISDKKWLKKGNWEWGEITIITRTD